MNLSQDPLTSNETTIELAFTRPVDSKNAQVILKNPKTKKNLPIQGIVSSPEDLRVILVQLKEKMELTVPYELTLQKIVSLDGVELPPENRIPLKVVYNGVLPPLTSITNDNAAPSVALDDTSDELDSGFTEPVPIDHLPQTGPRSILFIALLSAFIVFLIQKKLSKRA
ncbi:hypothetical protein H6768_05880 [Candidatus Peribacteria bacterium]|nr:hypothetical protein [Candidatus Peribacteria bacterium]